MHIVVRAVNLRLDEAVAGQGPGGAIAEEFGHALHLRIAAFQRRGERRQRIGVNHCGQEKLRAITAVYFPAQPAGRIAGGELVEQRRRGAARLPILHRFVDDPPPRCPGMPERAVAKGLAGDRAVPIVKHRKFARQRAEHRQVRRRVALHDLAVFIVGRIAALVIGVHSRRFHLFEVADIVGDEPVHGRRRIARRQVVGRLGIATGPVEQLDVDVRVFLARIGVGLAKVDRRDRPGPDDLPAVTGLVDRRRGDGVEQRLGAAAGKQQPVESLAQRRIGRDAIGVQIAQHVIERAVLHHQHHDMVDGG